MFHQRSGVIGEWQQQQQPTAGSALLTELRNPAQTPKPQLANGAVTSASLHRISAALHMSCMCYGAIENRRGRAMRWVHGRCMGGARAVHGRCGQRALCERGEQQKC
ncbi:hypothetical protein VZT92_014777 [Zoarces viviparus]|uniref:Uncharacterized protein n=1 Tax=Zoarces viviparus TaxID=48416 RepID=A0AAW1F165_ZOAVI